MRPVNPPTEAPPHVFTVGLTGGIGSGKSTVAHGFATLGINIIDADEIAHQLTSPAGAAIPAIIAAFGLGMLQTNGALDRAAMRQLVFTDEVARKRLEAILHPMIRTECARRLAKTSSAYAILMVPLLVESEAWRKRCDRILVIDCPPEIQVQRIIARSGLSEEEAHRIMAAQASREARLAAASEVLDNSGALPALQARINTLHRHYLLESAQTSGKS